MSNQTKWFTNITQVPIGGKMPSEDFPLSVDADGAPVELYWRKRLKEGAIEPKATEVPETPQASSGRASEARKTVKKGKSE
jgi:hypothetical protein